MRQQQTWSKLGSLGGPTRDRQKQFKRDNNVLSFISVTPIDVKEDKGLFLKVVSNLKELGGLLDNKWLPLKIEVTSFISDYGTLDSFKNQWSELRFILNYYYPFYDEGFITLIGKSSNISDKNVSSKASLGSLINGINLSNKENRLRVIKALNTKNNTGIVLESNEISLNVDGQKFLQINEAGVSIGGSLSLQSSPDKCKFGGFVSMQNFFTGLIPSTYTSPIPSFQISLPLEQLESMKELASIATGFIK